MTASDTGSGPVIQPIMLHQHPAHRTQIDILRSAFPGRVAATMPSDTWEHDRWRPKSLMRTLHHYAGRLEALTLDKNMTVYVSGPLRPFMHRLLKRGRFSYLDVDDPLSLYNDGWRNSLKGSELRGIGKKLMGCLETGHISFWSNAQLGNFVANFHFDETAELLATNRLSVLPPAIVPQVEVSNIGGSEALRCLTIASGKFWHKGVPDAIAAVDRLVGNGVPVSLTIVGADVPEDWLAFINSRPYLELKTKLSRTELNDLMRSHDVLVFPSHHDTYGWVMLEAKSFGMPVVTTDFYNRSEIVSHGIDGLLVQDAFANPFLPVGPAPYAAAHLSISGARVQLGRLIEKYIDDLAQSLGKLAADREFLQRLGTAALAGVQPQSKFGVATRIARLSPYLAA